MVLLKNSLKKFSYKHVLTSLASASPDTLNTISAQKAIEAFHHAAKAWPLYHKLLEESNINPLSISDIQNFQKLVPIIDKDIIFNRKDTFSASIHANQNIQSILLSSGSTGTFSFGLNTREENTLNATFLNILFQNYFNILNERTLIVNCLSQAVKFPYLDAVVMETGPRNDSLLHTLELISPQFAQTILIGDNYFIKNALEEGLSRINYRAMKIHLILGGVYLPESLRTYLANLLHIDLSDKNKAKILSTMGISEFGLNVFFESDETITLRRMVKDNEKLRQILLPPGHPPYLPMFFNYFPKNYFIEEINNNIVITNLNLTSLLPLIRYNTFDQGSIVTYKKLKEILEEQLEGLLPPFKSSLILVYGKMDCVPDQLIYAQQIQEGLYENPQVACQTTGYFRISLKDDQPFLEIQIKKGIAVSEELLKLFSKAVFKYIQPHHFPLKLYAYQDFPYGMELDYERKFKYT